MIGYICYALVTFYSIVLLQQIYIYISRPAPTGPDSVPWIWGVFYNFFLGGIVLVSIVLIAYGKYMIALIATTLPIAFIISQNFPPVFRHLYARWPSREHIPNLQLTMDNTTDWKVHIKLDCLFSTSTKGTLILYRTLDYFLEPSEIKTVNLTRHETGLLAVKSPQVTIEMYEQVLVRQGQHSFWYEIQPCFNLIRESPENFKKGAYTVTIKEDKQLTQVNGRDGVIEQMKKTLSFVRGTLPPEDISYLRPKK